MENLHEQIKAYIPKLEYSIREYMRNPATPNAAQGIMAMVECLNMLKGAEGAICTGREMTKADRGDVGGPHGQRGRHHRPPLGC